MSRSPFSPIQFLTDRQKLFNPNQTVLVNDLMKLLELKNPLISTSDHLFVQFPTTKMLKQPWGYVSIIAFAETIMID